MDIYEEMNHWTVLVKNLPKDADEVRLILAETLDSVGSKFCFVCSTYCGLSSRLLGL